VGGVSGVGELRSAGPERNIVTTPNAPSTAEFLTSGMVLPHNLKRLRYTVTFENL
jgi:hypothetical protein